MLSEPACFGLAAMFVSCLINMLFRMNLASGACS